MVHFLVKPFCKRLLRSLHQTPGQFFGKKLRASGGSICETMKRSCPLVKLV
jgi:hypothetical protein